MTAKAGPSVKHLAEGSMELIPICQMGNSLISMLTQVNEVFNVKIGVKSSVHDVLE